MRPIPRWLTLLGLVVVVAGVTAAACTDIAGGDGDGTGPTGDGDGDGDGDYAGAAVCSTCHDSPFAHWRLTRHADALESLRAVDQDENAYCLGCHTVGFGEPGGFVDEASTGHLAGVQCENCHGAAGGHAADPTNEDLHPKVDVSSALCGNCHSGAHNPTFEEWGVSKHADALANLTALPFAQDACLECHSEDYRFAIEHDDEHVEVPTVETAKLSVECATCHAPHSELHEDAQLRAPVAELCGGCHTVEESKLGESPHHPQIEMLRGDGAFTEGGGSLEQQGTHSGLVFADGGEACAQCHVVQHEVEDPQEGDPNVTGHTFNPFNPELGMHTLEQKFSGCRICHTPEDADMMKQQVQSEIDGRLQTLAPFFDESDPSYIDPSGLSGLDADRLKVAKFNYQFVGADGSTGIHNSDYARAALDIADTITQDLSP